MLYYGTEAGMWGADDPDDRKPMVWKDFDYEPEKEHPLGKDRPVDENKFDESLFNWYKKLGKIWNAHWSLRTGSFKELVVENEKNIVVFARFMNNQMFCLVAINRSEKSHQIKVPLEPFVVKKNRHLENLTTGSRVQIDGQEAIITLPPVSGAILSPEND